MRKVILYFGLLCIPSILNCTLDTQPILSVNNTLEELTQERDRVKQTSETLTQDVGQFHKILLEKVQTDITTIITTIDKNFVTKSQEIIEKTKSSTVQQQLLTTIVELLQLTKNIASTYNTQAKSILDNWYTPLTQTVLITNNNIRIELGNTIGLAAASLEELKKALPKPIQHMTAETTTQKGPEKPITIKDITTSPGIQGLYEFIIKQPVKDDTEEKMVLLQDIKSHQKKIDAVFNAFNDAAKTLVQRINKTQRIDLETLEPIKKSYEIVADPAFAQAPNLTKFDNLRKVLEDLIDITNVESTKLSTLVSSFADFIKATYTNKNTQELSAIAELITQLKKTITTLSEILEDGLSTIFKMRRIFT